MCIAFSIPHAEHLKQRLRTAVLLAMGEEGTALYNTRYVAAIKEGTASGKSDPDGGKKEPTGTTKKTKKNGGGQQNDGGKPAPKDLPDQDDTARKTKKPKMDTEEDPAAPNNSAGSSDSDWDISSEG